MQQINFYRNKVAINVLAKDIANAREIYDAAEGHAVIGILSAQFSSDSGVDAPRWGRTMMFSLPSRDSSGKSVIYLAMMPFSMASFSASLFTRPPLAKFKSLAPFW